MFKINIDIFKVFLGFLRRTQATFLCVIKRPQVLITEHIGKNPVCAL